jgi:hypothetical protein
MFVTKKNNWYVMKETGIAFETYKPLAGSPIHVQAFELGLPEQGGKYTVSIQLCSAWRLAATIGENERSIQDSCNSQLCTMP